MQNRIILVSEDSDFFEYILPKLNLRKSDELYRFCFDELPEKLDLILSSLLIINSEKASEKTIELLELIKGAPSIVFSYNENEEYKIKCLKSGSFGYVTYFTSEEEFNAMILSAFRILSNIKKQAQYREILVSHSIITPNNEVFLDYNKILDGELEKNSKNAVTSVLVAISPNDKTKFLLQSNQIETFILANIRQSDLLMNYAPNKYFLLLNDTNIERAQKIWEKIKSMIPEKIYAGMALSNGKTRGQLVNEALNKLHEAINRDVINESANSSEQVGIINFKFFRKEFYAKLEKTITPVFYQITQKYSDKLFGMSINHKTGEGYGELNIKSKYLLGTLKITTPGCSKINIDVLYEPLLDKIENKRYPASKRITLEPDELEQGIIEDILEQFVLEFKEEVENEYS